LLHRSGFWYFTDLPPGAKAEVSGIDKLQLSLGASGTAAKNKRRVINDGNAAPIIRRFAALGSIRTMLTTRQFPCALRQEVPQSQLACDTHPINCENPGETFFFT
jgi:hypothetical protein